MSNVRSTTRPAVQEAPLPLGLPAEETQPAAQPRRKPAGEGTSRRGRRPTKRSAGAEFAHRLGSDALASLGFPAGTQMIVDTTQKPRRGQILFVRTQGRLKVGVLEVQFGRSVLRSDHGTFWLDPASEIWGVATAADPPIEGLLL